ncbi:hypothetical protein A9W97_17815 [Mycobacterium gordonae]|nr:hypothetical protein A9W97_17815 [Mycobacterium gordonae]
MTVPSETQMDSESVPDESRIEFYESYFRAHHGLSCSLFTASDGERLHVYTAGPDAASAILLCNAPGMSVEFVRPLAHRLAGAFRVITWESRELPGVYHDAQSLRHLMDRQVRDGLEVLAHFGVSGAKLLGWSAGTRIALEIASIWDGAASSLVLMNGAYPTELAELTALTRKYADDLQPGPTGSDDTPARAVETGAIFMTRDLSGARPGSNAAAMYPFGPPQRPAENIRAYAKLLLSQADNALDLSKLPYVPALILTCDGDVTSPPSSSTRFASEVPLKAQCISFPAGDHFSLYWDPRFIDAVDGFVKCSELTETASSPDVAAMPRFGKVATSTVGAGERITVAALSKRSPTRALA